MEICIHAYWNRESAETLPAVEDDMALLVLQGRLLLSAKLECSHL